MKTTLANGAIIEGNKKQISEIVEKVSVETWRSMTYEQRLEIGKKVANESQGKIKLTIKENGDALLTGEFKKKDRQPLKYRTGAGWIYLSRRDIETWLLKNPNQPKKSPKKEQQVKNSTNQNDKAKTTDKVKNPPHKTSKNQEQAQTKSNKNTSETIIKLQKPKKMMERLYRFTEKKRKNGYNHEVIQGVYFANNYLVATDNFRLIRIPFEYNGKPFMLPNELVRLIARNAKSDVDVVIDKDKYRVGIKFELNGKPFEQFADMIAPSFPKYEQLFNLEPKTFVTFDAKDLAKRCRQFEQVAPKNTPMRVTIENGDVKLSFKSKDAEDTHDMGEIANGSAEFGINMKFLKEAAMAFDNPIAMQISAPHKQILLTDYDTEVIVMPYLLEKPKKVENPKPSTNERPKVELNEHKRACCHPVSGMSFVITGGLKRMNRKTAESKLRSLGARVSHKVRETTDYLVVADGAECHTKMREAKELGIPTMSESEFMKLLAA